MSENQRTLLTSTEIGHLRAAVDKATSGGTPEDWSPLMRLLAERDPLLRQAAVEEMIRLGDRSLGVLSSQLEHWDWDLRARAADALGRIGNPAALVPLEALLDDAHESVCIAAIRAVGVIGGDDAGRILAKALRDPLESVAAQAALLLGQQGHTAAITPLVGALLAPASRVRSASRHALALLQWRPESPDDQVRWHFAGEDWGLALEVGPQGINAFREALESPDPDLKLSSARILANLAVKTRSPLLRKVAPLLREKLPLLGGNEELYDVFTRTRSLIDEHCEALPSLPVAAESAEHHLSQLPYPAESGDIAVSELPLPAGEAVSPPEVERVADAAADRSESLLSRVRRALGG